MFEQGGEDLVGEGRRQGRVGEAVHCAGEVRVVEVPEAGYQGDVFRWEVGLTREVLVEVRERPGGVFEHVEE